MDEIQRELRESLEAGPDDTMRELLFELLLAGGEHEEWVLKVAIGASETERWWYDTLVEFARRWRQPDGWEGRQDLPTEFVNWCAGVAGNEIERPKQRGRPRKMFRDILIRIAVDRYKHRSYGKEPVSRAEAFSLVAEAAGLEESVVARIWRRETRVK